jgi:hypothetical protein
VLELLHNDRLLMLHKNRLLLLLLLRWNTRRFLLLVHMLWLNLNDVLLAPRWLLWRLLHNMLEDRALLLLLLLLHHHLANDLLAAAVGLDEQPLLLLLVRLLVYEDNVAARLSSLLMQ